MPFDEDVVVRMGLDRRPFDKALGGAKSALDVFKGAIGAMAAQFGLGKIVGFAKGIGELANEIRRSSEALDISTDFLQTWRFAVSQSGGNAESAGKALDKFTKHLAESGKSGSDVEVELRKVADAMAAQPDPVKRAKIAFDAFGKGAGELIPLLAGGSKALDEFAKSASKLSEADIKSIDDFADSVEGAMQRAQVAGGRFLGGWAKLWQGIGAATVKGVNLSGSLIDIGKQVIGYAEDITKAEAAQKTKAASDKKAAIELTKLAEAHSRLQKAYEDAMGAQTKADFDALTDAQKLNVLLEFRLKLLKELSKDSRATVANAKKFAALAGIGPDVTALEEKVGIEPGNANAPAIPNARSRALAANPRLQAMIDDQAKMASMSARDRTLSLNPALRDVFGKQQGMKKTDVQETSKGVWRLVELAETEGLLIKPTNGE